MDRFIIGLLFTIFVIIPVVLVYLAILAGSFEIIYWFFNGEFFHVFHPSSISTWG